MTSHVPRFLSARGTKYLHTPVFAVNLAAGIGPLYARPPKSVGVDSPNVETIFIVAGVVIVAVDPHVNAFACNVFPLGHIFCNGGNFGLVKTRTLLDAFSPLLLSGSLKETIKSIGDTPVSAFSKCSSSLDLGESLEGLPDRHISVSRLLFSDVSSAHVSAPVSDPYILGHCLESDTVADHTNSAEMMTDEGHSSRLTTNSEKGPSRAGDATGGSPPHPPSTDVIHSELDINIQSETPLFQTVCEGAPPPPPPPLSSSTTSGDPDDKHRTTFIDWKYVMIALAVFVGLKQVSRGAFRGSSVNKGQKKKLSNNIMKPTERVEPATVAETGVVPAEIPAQNIAESSLQLVLFQMHIPRRANVPAFGQLESTMNCSHPVSVPCEHHLFVNSTIDTDILATGKLPIQETSHECALVTACGVVQYGFNFIHLTLFLGLLLMILLAYIGTCLAILAAKLFRTQVNNLIESSLDNNTYEQIENAVPGALLHGTVLPPVEIKQPLCSTLPLGCVFLTPSGPCTVDPRPRRQLTLEEDEQTFGVPLESAASSSIPSASSSSSCFAGTSRPGSPKGPRRVTFAEEDQIFVLPPNTATRDRNLRRRLSRRAMAAAGGTVTAAPVAKRR